MSVPFLVSYDRMAQATNGIEAIVNWPSANYYGANGVALVTGFLSGENWIYCADAVSTSWTLCSSAVTTTWTSSYTIPITAWTLVPTG